MDFKPIDLGSETPGQRMAARRTICVRPGMPGFLEEELRQVVAALEANPGMHTVLGTDLRAQVGYSEEEGAFLFVVRRRAADPVPRKRKARAAA